jgi:excisionase family DNA binding protein
MSLPTPSDRLRFLTVRQVAEELKVSVSAVYGLIYRGTLRAAKLGRSWRVGVEDLEAYQAGRG